MDNKATHTPGPWLFRAKNDSVWTTPPAGSLYKFGDHIFTFHAEDGPSDEDLALILAAPELLTALQACLAYLENDVPLPNYGDAEKRAARAAIAKATGSAA